MGFRNSDDPAISCYTDVQLLESLQIPLPEGVKSLIMRRFKSHYDDTDNLNMRAKMMMIMLVLMMMSMVVLVFVDLGKCSAKSSAVEEGDIII